jgi:YegS/Rv2252/BmrU family lipid kinase
MANHPYSGEKRALILLNPEAGHGRARKMASLIPSLAKDLGWVVEQRETRESGHEVEIAAEACRNGWPVIIAVGGDGTVHGAVNGLLSEGETETVLAHVPVGTGNDLAQTVGLNKRKAPGQNLRRILDGEIRLFDVGRALDEYFINSVGLGFAAAAATNLVKYKRLGGFTSYVVAVYQTFFTYKAPELAVRSTAYSERGQILMVEATLGKTTGGGFKVSPDADPCDGQLDVCLIREIGTLTFLRYVPRVIRGTHVGLPPVEIFQTPRVEVQSFAGPPIVHLDGELRSAKTDTLVVEILPGKLPVLCAV